MSRDARKGIEKPAQTKKISKKASIMRSVKTKAAKKLFPKAIGEDEEDVDCLICSEKFSNSRGKEVWVRCEGCLQSWAHFLCTKQEAVYICHECSEL